MRVSDDCWSYWCSRVTTVQAMTLDMVHHVRCVLLLPSTMMGFIDILDFYHLHWLTFFSFRMEWYQRSALLWANLGAQHRPPWGLDYSFGIGRHRHRATPGRFTGHCIYRSLG